ncbi:MAG: class I SAM-dependent methyltransferase [Roseibacillus sp.]
MQPTEELSGAQSYLGDGQGATARLTEEVMAEIDAEGPISFRKFFDLVLYHPDWGYYARPQQSRTGKEGDFFTAVSVGPLFGRILAEYAFATWEQQEKPTVFRVVEWGAEQGDLAKDILAGGQGIGGEFAQALQYAVVEPLPQKRAALAEALEGAEVVAKAKELTPQPGLVIGNELIDALSFWLIRWEKGQWLEKRVAREGESLRFELAEPDSELSDRLALVKDTFSEGYETELRPSLSPLLAEMKSVLTSGEILLFDYGFERNDLYHPSRTTGTLRTYGRHQADEDPLVNLGQLDITAHVDFTALEEDAQAIGLNPQPLTSQGHFLTKAAASFLTKMDGQVDSNFIRQFQTLTHPAHLGTKFSVFRATV